MTLHDNGDVTLTHEEAQALLTSVAAHLIRAGHYTIIPRLNAWLEGTTEDEQIEKAHESSALTRALVLEDSTLVDHVFPHGEFAHVD